MKKSFITSGPDAGQDCFVFFSANFGHITALQTKVFLCL